MVSNWLYGSEIPLAAKPLDSEIFRGFFIHAAFYSSSSFCFLSIRLISAFKERSLSFAFSTTHSLTSATRRNEYAGGLLFVLVTCYLLMIPLGLIGILDTNTERIKESN